MNTFKIRALPQIYILLILLFTCFSAWCEKSATLDLSFDEHIIPHATFLINEHPVYAMIDTGSSLGFHIPQERLNVFDNLRMVKQHISIDLTGKKIAKVDFVAGHVNLNGLLLKDVQVTPFVPWGLLVGGKGELPNNPVIGLGVFKDKQILINYLNNTFSLYENFDYDSFIVNDFREFDYEQTPEGLVFVAKELGNEYRLILDTGATVNFIFKAKLKNHRAISCLQVHPDMDNKDCKATSLTFTSKDKTETKSSAVILDGNFEHMGNIDGLVGNNFLWHKKLLIDFKNKKIYLSIIT